MTDVYANPRFPTIDPADMREIGRRVRLALNRIIMDSIDTSATKQGLGAS